jgi:hypothetical protein
MTKMQRVAIVAAMLAVFMAAGATVFALPAYIDIQSGIIVGRGEESLSGGRAYDDVRLSAIKNAKENIMKVLERQPVDLESLESKTIGDYLAGNPGKKSVVNAFLDSATVYRESKTKDGKVEVTLLLQIEGPDGYKMMLARLTGKAAELEKTSPQSSGNMDDAVKDVLKNNLTTRGPNETVRPYKIVLLPFMNSSEAGKIDLPSIINEQILARFKNDRRFVFATGSEAESILNDSSLSSDLISKADANTKIRLDGVDGLVDGIITAFRPDTKKHGVGGTGFLEVTYEAEVELHVLNAKTGRWIYFDTIRMSVTDRAFTTKYVKDTALPVIKAEDFADPQSYPSKITNSLVDKIEVTIRNLFPMEGYVLKVVGERVYINLTKGDGLKEGDFLTVYRIGDELVDPVSGEVIDRIKDRIGTIRVDDAKDTYTQCVTSETPVESLIPGDVVMLK